MGMVLPAIKSVQAISISGANGATQAITAVGAKAFIVLTGGHMDSVGFSGTPRLVLTNSTTVTMNHVGASAGSATGWVIDPA